MDNINKEYVSSRIKDLEKLGWKTFNFNSRNPMPQGALGWCDYVCFLKRKGIVVFIETKLSKGEKLRAKQKEFAEFMVEWCPSNGKALYYNAASTAIGNIIDRLERI